VKEPKEAPGKVGRGVVVSSSGDCAAGPTVGVPGRSC